MGPPKSQKLCIQPTFFVCTVCLPLFTCSFVHIKWDRTWKRSHILFSSESVDHGFWVNFHDVCCIWSTLYHNNMRCPNMVVCIPDNNLNEYKCCSHEGFKGCTYDRCALPFIAVLTLLPSFQDRFKVCGLILGTWNFIWPLAWRRLLFQVSRNGVAMQ